MKVMERDKKMLRFIEEFKVATTNTIQELFYPSLIVAQRRLKLLFDNNYLKRDREHFTAQYYYYMQKPNQLRHSLLLTHFYRELNKIAKIELFQNEFTVVEGIRPDGFVAFEIGERKYIAFIEVEISNKGFDINKYEKLYKSGKWKRYFPVFPSIIAITDKRIPDSRLKIINIDEEISDIKKRLD